MSEAVSGLAGENWGKSGGVGTAVYMGTAVYTYYTLT